MATKEKYEDHSWMLDALSKAQEADHDRRAKAREAHAFVDAPDGQWEERWKEINSEAPRYTFDMTTSLIDQIHGQMARTDYDIKVRPAGGDASKKAALTYNGLVRNIENISDADQVYDQAGLEMITAGVDGWEVVQEYVDGNSFDQDLIIKAIPDYLDSTWLGIHKKRDGSDAKFAFKLTGLDPDEFKKLYPDRDASGNMGSDRDTNTYYHRNDVVMIGDFRYLLPVTRELVLMDNGEVFEVDEDFQKVADELLLKQDIREVDRRKRTKLVMYSRLFDSNGWIGNPRETLFENWLNIIPVYANFKYIENKVIYWGAVEKIMDPQRILNYSLSREVAETSLAPKDFFWSTNKKMEGQDWSKLNVSQDPVQTYTHDPLEAGPPVRSGGAQVSPGLARITDFTRQIIGQTAGMFHASMGDNPGLQSGIAIEKLQDKGDAGNDKYLTARAIAQRHTGRILVNTIPRVYKPGRQVRILGEDGSFDMETIGERILDEQTLTLVTLNDLATGNYDVYCSVGPSFKNRQSETISAITSIAEIDPSIIQLGADVLMNNMDSPGMDQLSARVRRRLFMAGEIPPDQMTDEEKAEMQQRQQQPPQPDAMTIAAMAEDKKAEADLATARIKEQEAQTKFLQAKAKAQYDSDKLMIDAFNAETERGKVEAELKLKGAKLSYDLLGRIGQGAGPVSQ